MGRQKITALNKNGSLDWFGGNADALEMYRLLCDLAHLWDDLVDQDKPLGESEINRAFGICLIALPSNQFYRQIQADILPMWIAVVSAYEAANHMEREKELHGLEISHSLRYAAGHMIAYAMNECITSEDAKKFIPMMWKEVVWERFEEYVTEHSNGSK